MYNFPFIVKTKHLIHENTSTKHHEMKSNIVMIHINNTYTHIHIYFCLNNHNVFITICRSSFLVEKTKAYYNQSKTGILFYACQLFMYK